MTQDTQKSVPSQSAPKSAYEIKKKRSTYGEHVFALLVDNEPGVLARVVGLFTGRGYNIASLTVSETIQDKDCSRITLVTSGTPRVIDQIRRQLRGLICVREVADMSQYGDFDEAEVVLVRIENKPALQADVKRLCEQYGATIDSQQEKGQVLRMTGEAIEVSDFINDLNALDTRIEIARSGVVVMWREFDHEDHKIGDKRSNSS